MNENFLDGAHLNSRLVMRIVNYRLIRAPQRKRGYSFLFWMKPAVRKLMEQADTLILKLESIKLLKGNGFLILMKHIIRGVHIVRIMLALLRLLKTGLMLKYVPERRLIPKKRGKQWSIIFLKKIFAKK